MKRSWTTGLSAEESKELRANFKESLVMRRRLKKLLEDKAAGSVKESRSKLLYENPNWALLQADQRGYERAMSEIIDFIFDDV